jgi:hypothetical protein
MDTATNKRGGCASPRARGFDNYSQQHQELPLDLGVVDIVFARGPQLWICGRRGSSAETEETSRSPPPTNSTGFFNNKLDVPHISIIEERP